MNNTKKLTLINGVYKQEDAKEILLNVFSQKIHFHELKRFSMLERFGKEDETAKKRILELKASVNKINEIILLAIEENKSITIQSDVSISLSDDL